MKLEQIIEKVIKFRNDRDWEQFHNPKDLAISLSIESAELLECFQWKSASEVEELTKSGVSEDIKEELADIGIYLLLLCEATGVDLKEAILEKIMKNEMKYPVEKAKGNAKKYTEL
ncbi:nucleotide pyrophosphohydrolase [Wukongibacter baidiensis]